MLCTAARALVAATAAAKAAGEERAEPKEERAAAEALCQIFTNALEVLPSLPAACACDARAAAPGTTAHQPGCEGNALRWPSALQCTCGARLGLPGVMRSCSCVGRVLCRRVLFGPQECRCAVA